MSIWRFIAVLTAAAVLCIEAAKAWVYPEHRDIAVLAVQKLDAKYRASLDKMWSLARKGNESRLSTAVVIDTLDAEPTTIDWAAWPAIAGDHSCSPMNLLGNVLETDWILDVARITEKMKRRLAGAVNRSERVNFLRDQDIELQRADPEYATRAGSNNVHFLLPRDSTRQKPSDYLLHSHTPGVEINALSVYVWYHYRAMAKAALISKGNLSNEEKQKLALAALADEAFALHFLEDVFASGHVAGTWGNAALRKGTHDYYNEHGLETNTWEGDQIVLLGDAYMRHEDAERPSDAVKLSLQQLIDAFEGNGVTGKFKYERTVGTGLDLTTADSLNVCSNNYVPKNVADDQLMSTFLDVISTTPIPALKEGYGELPRFRAEIGPFVGAAAAVRGTTWNGGFSPKQDYPGGVGGIGMSARFGLGLEGVTNETCDGLVFLDLGFCQDGSSSMNYYGSGTSNAPTLAQQAQIRAAGSLLSAIPARQAWSARLRMPFWLIPGDLILAAPFLIPIDMDLYTQMAVVASNGGLIPWQAGIVTPIGRIQFMLGREVGVYFYGYGDEEIPFAVPPQDSGIGHVISLRTIQLEFPFFEYRPFRTFSMNQSSSLVAQLYAAVDIPTVWWNNPDRTKPIELRTIFGLGLRIAFDWRYYF